MVIEDLKKEKAHLIGRYMQLQDMVDQYNHEIYKLCCQIEALNILIQSEEKKVSTRNGSATHPENGSRSRA